MSAATMVGRVDVSDPSAMVEEARREMRRGKRWTTVIGAAAFLAAFTASVFIGEVSVTEFVDGLPGLTSYLHDIAPVLRPSHLLEDVGEWYWGIWRWLGLLWDTLLLAFVATGLGCGGALLFCFAGSRNLVSLTGVYFAARRLAELARAVPELVYALIFVFAFGIGPLAGVLAIAVHTAGALGKLFAEVNENIDLRPIEAVKAAGGNWFTTIRYGVVPQVLPNYASYALLRFEINVRSAAVIGFVGAGGIGQELMYVIRQFIYPDISAIVLMIILTVVVIDLTCERLRHWLIGREQLA
jgi:phosphonate transport system permease protein